MRRLLWIGVALLALAIVGVGLAVAWLATSESAVAWLAARAVAAAGGALEIGEPRGYLTGTVRIARLRYEDEDVRISAEEVALEPVLVAALARRLELATLAARTLEIVIKPTPGPSSPPDTLALPLGVAIGRATVGRVVVRSEPDEVAFDAVTLAYEGSATRHAIGDLKAGSPLGALAGAIVFGAAPPFPASGSASLVREDAKLGVALNATLGGGLELLDVALGGTAAGAEAGGTVRLAPFAERWLADANVRLADLDLARLDAAWPRTALAVEASGASRDGTAIAGRIEARNAAAGTLTDGRLPVADLASPFVWEGGELSLTALAAGFGAGGSASGTARAAPGRATLDLAVRRLDLRAFHRPLRTTRLDGTVSAAVTASTQDVRAKLAQANVRFELDGTRRGDSFAVKRFVAAAGGGALTAEGTIGLAGKQAFDARVKLDRFDPSAFGAYPSARINGDVAATGALEPRWHADARFEVRDSRWRDARLAGDGRFAASPSEVHDLHASLRVGANRLVAQGGLGRPGDSLAISLAAPRLADLDPRLAGRARVNGTLRGALDRPAIELDATVEQLELPGGYRAKTLTAHGTVSPDDDPRVDLDVATTSASAGRVVLGAASAKATGSVGRHVVELAASGGDIDLTGRLAGRWRRGEGWAGTVDTLANRGRFPVKLLAPVAVETGPSRIAMGEAALEFGEGRLAIRSLRWENGRLSTQGELAGVPIAPFLALAAPPAEVASTLAVRGTWSIETTPRLNGTVALARDSGDVAIGDPGTGSTARLPLELDELRVDAKLVDDAASGTAVLTSRRLGTANATFEVGRAPGAEPGTFSADAPLAARMTAAIASLRPLGVLLNGQPLIDGAVNASLAANGTLRAPRLTGRVDATGLALEVPAHGVRLVDGRLAATLDAEALRVEAFEIRGGEGRLLARGVAPRAGDTAVEWQAENLRLFGLPDRLLTLDGAGKLAIVRGRLVLEGALTAREGYIEFARQRGTTLGDDVVVIGRPAKPAPRAAAGRSPLRATLDLDFGRKFRILGAGLDTELAGKLRVETRDTGELVAKGEIAAVRGLYFFLGQRLEIERGRLIFDGPLENPALDVFAVRRGLQVEPGVEVTGTLRNPRVQVVSRPPLPEGEKLAWLVLGRPLDTASAADAVLLQSAAASLLDDSNAIPIGRRIAQSMGLDDIGLKGGTTVQGSAVSIGKRLSDRLYLTFEQGLATARTLVTLEYLLGRGFRARASGGQDSSVGVFYTRSFD
jgi:translocation and assembly module TamB